jgi:hypothetical protein
LWKFLHNQRTLYRNGVLQSERYDKLVEFGFDFEAENARTSWEMGFRLLVDFYGEHGHVEVPGTNKVLHRWVIIQRKYYRLKRKRLTGYRIQKLNAIDFKWESR